jgi:hypothetical protein
MEKAMALCNINVEDELVRVLLVGKENGKKLKHWDIPMEHRGGRTRREAIYFAHAFRKWMSSNPGDANLLRDEIRRSENQVSPRPQRLAEERVLARI